MEQPSVGFHLGSLYNSEGWFGSILGGDTPSQTQVDSCDRSTDTCQGSSQAGWGREKGSCRKPAGGELGVSSPHEGSG